MIQTLTPAPALETARLTLRPLAASDAPRLARLANDYDVASMVARLPHPYSLADAETYIGLVRGRDPQLQPTFAVDLPGEGLIGVMGFHPRAGLGPEAGYWLGRPYWGRGYATEALRRAMRWVRDDWGVRCVLAGHFVDNPASGVVLCRAGFLYTGETQLTPSLARGEAVSSRRLVWLA